VSLVWQRRVGRASDRRGGGLNGGADAAHSLEDDVALVRRAAARGLLNRALDRALELARDEADDGAAIPAVLRPLRKFRKLPKAALEPLALALHGDEAFRRRLVDCVQERDVGALALRWLRQDAGWQAAISAALGDMPPSATPDLKALQRKLSGAERASARAKDRVAVLETELERQQERVETARAQVRTMQRDRDAARRTANKMRAELDELQTAYAKLEQSAAKRDDERRRLRERIRELEERALGPVNARETRELQRLTRAVAASARAAAADADALDRELGERLTPEPKVITATTRQARRRPTRMPSGVVDDSVAGAEHLVSRPGAMLLVDGYNATLSSWPELALDHQRERLVGLLHDLTARVVGLEVHVVFDGDDQVIMAGRRRRSVVHVHFSPPSVEADDVVLAMIEDIPIDRVVIIASNDRRVRDAARAGGANVISVQQLLALVR
jgi:predicted RNA-binding protein with PIN domain